MLKTKLGVDRFPEATAQQWRNWGLQQGMQIPEQDGTQSDLPPLTHVPAHFSNEQLGIFHLSIMDCAKSF